MQEPLCPLTSQLLTSAGFRHAFFTRAGGVSRGEFASLNFSTSVGDDPESVIENTARAARWLELESLYCANQVHGASVLEITPGMSPQGIQSTPADAIVSTQVHVACCVRTADCVPLLVADPHQGRVAAIHAGWRGVVAGVVPRAIERLTELGSSARNLLVAIGPHIRVSAFEVTEQVAELLARAAPTRAIVQSRSESRPYVDLAAGIQEQLQRAGVLPANIDDVGGCTFSETTRFYSYRRQGPASGRHLHAIVPR